MWFEFITNTNCNWNCAYCAFDRVEDKCMTIESIDSHQYIYDTIKLINNSNNIENSTIVVEGGEIGLIEDNELLEHLFKKFNQPVIVNTNGKFFEQDRTSLYQYIDKFFYHVAEDAKTLIKIEPSAVPIEVVYGLVDDDADAITKFVKYNNQIDINYTGYEFITTAPENANDMIIKQTECQSLNSFVSIDLAREVLCICSARGSHVTIPLNEENFKKVLTGFDNFDQNDMCNTCYRTCTSFDHLHVIEQKKLIATILGM